MLDDPLRKRALGKGRVAREQKVERAAQRIDVGAVVEVRGFQGLLGGHVIDGPKGRSARRRTPRLVALVQAGQAQIENLDHTLVVDQQVRGLDVAVDEVAGVGVGKALGRLANVVRRAIEGQRAVEFDQPLQVLAVDELHDDEIAVHFIVDAIGLDDIGVIERGDGPGLGEEALQRGPVLGDRAGNDLQGHAAIHGHVLGKKDGAHAPLAQALDELVLAQAELCPLAHVEEDAGLPAADEIFAAQGLGQGSCIGRFRRQTLSLDKLLRAEQLALFQRRQIFLHGANGHNDLHTPFRWGTYATLAVC